jgi:hypothetical protein
MSATVTKVSGPGVISGLGVEYVFTVLLDTVFAAGGESIDLTDYFTQVYNANCGANDADADNRYAYNCVHPGKGTALTSSNFLISVSQSNDTVQALDEANGVDLSSVGELNLRVLGTAAIQ